MLFCLFCRAGSYLGFENESLVAEYCLSKYFTEDQTVCSGFLVSPTLILHGSVHWSFVFDVLSRFGFRPTIPAISWLLEKDAGCFCLTALYTQLLAPWGPGYCLSFAVHPSFCLLANWRDYAPPSFSAFYRSSYFPYFRHISSSLWLPHSAVESVYLCFILWAHPRAFSVIIWLF